VQPIAIAGAAIPPFFHPMDITGKNLGLAVKYSPKLEAKDLKRLLCRD
jgi:hypothetical protein